MNDKNATLFPKGNNSRLRAAVLLFIYVLLCRTDAGIRAQQAELRKSEEKFRSLFENSRDALMTLEPPS